MPFLSKQTRRIYSPHERKRMRRISKLFPKPPIQPPSEYVRLAKACEIASRLTFSPALKEMLLKASDKFRELDSQEVKVSIEQVVHWEPLKE